MAEPISFWGQTIADNTVKSNGQPETASYRVPITTLTAANLVAQEVLIEALRVAILAITIGVVVKDNIVLAETNPNFGPASDVHAQRENKILLRYHDNTSHDQFRVSIPTFDLGVLPTHSEFIDLTAGGGLALKTAFEAIVVSPDDAAHSVTLDSGQFVGRNS